MQQRQGNKLTELISNSNCNSDKDDYPCESTKLFKLKAYSL